MARRQIVVTGMGVWSSIGTDGETFRHHLERAASGIREDTNVFPGSQIWAGLIKDYNPRDHFTERELQQLDRAAQFAILAAEQAWRDAGADVPPERIALVSGTSHGGRSQFDDYIQNAGNAAEFETAHCLLEVAPHYTQTEAVAVHLNIRGPVATISNACSSSGGAIGYAFELLQAGKADIALAGGVDAFSRLTHAGFDALGAVARAACGPFSKTVGISLGEAAGFVVLEPLEHARSRGTPIYAELMGYGTSWDAYHLTEPHPSGEGLLRAISRAAACAGVAADEIDYVNAHGTGTRANDGAETLAIKGFFSSTSGARPVSSTKSFTGHTLGASAVLGFISTTLAMGAGFVPPTMNYTGPRGGCDLDYVPNSSRRTPVQKFCCQAAGFGGVNTVLIGGRLNGDARPVRTEDSVVISGIGVVSPIGHTLADFLNGLRGGCCGIDTVNRFDTAGCAAKKAGLITAFDPRRLRPSFEMRRLDRIVQYGAVAAANALDDACLLNPGTRTGLVVGTTRGAVASYEKFLDSVKGANWQAASPIHFPNLVMSSIGGQVSRLLGIKGAASTLVGGVGCGLQALAHAFELLRRDDTHDAVVVLTSDELGPLFFRLFDSLGMLNPEGLVCPYSPGASGTAMGEGAVAIVLERSRSASRRNIAAYACLRGYGLTSGTCDPQGEELERAMRLALEEAGITPDSVDAVYGQGRGLKSYDRREIRAIARLLRGNAAPVSCTNGNTGVAEASCGLFAVAAAALGLTHGEVCPIATADALHAELAFVRKKPLRQALRNALICAGTDNGNNAALFLNRDAVNACEICWRNS